MYTEEELVENIENALRAQGSQDWVFEDFSKVKNNKQIRNLLKRAYMETAEREYKNRHGIIHGLATAYNSIRLFELVRNGAVESDYHKIFEFSLDHSLLTLIIASYVHDTGRFYDDAVENHEQYIDDAIGIIQKLYQLEEIFQQPGRATSGSEMVRRVKELCLCHDRKLVPSGKVEIALIKLADALDSGAHRVYTKEDKRDDLGGYIDSVLPAIFNKDKSPIKYFGLLSLENIRYDWNASDRILEITFSIKDFACAEEIKKILNILDACSKNGQDSVKVLASKIHIYVEGRDAIRLLASKIQVPLGTELDRYRLHPSPIVTISARAITAVILGARLPLVGYKLDIRNLEGDSDLELPLTIENISNADGITFHQQILGGHEASRWEEINLKWFEDTALGLQNLPPPEYVRTERQGRRHVYRILLGRVLKVGETIKLKGMCRWPHLMNVMEDEISHLVATPTSHLRMEASFPEEVNQFSMQASLEVKNAEGKTILETPWKDQKIGNRRVLIAELSGLEHSHTYRLHWTLSK